MKLFEYMKEASVNPDQRSYELLITAHVVNRDVQSAFAALTAMVFSCLSSIPLILVLVEPWVHIE